MYEEKAFIFENYLMILWKGDLPELFIIIIPLELISTPVKIVNVQESWSEYWLMGAKLGVYLLRRIYLHIT